MELELDENRKKMCFSRIFNVSEQQMKERFMIVPDLFWTFRFNQSFDTSLFERFIIRLTLISDLFFDNRLVYRVIKFIFTSLWFAIIIDD